MNSIHVEESRKLERVTTSSSWQIQEAAGT